MWLRRREGVRPSARELVRLFLFFERVFLFHYFFSLPLTSFKFSKKNSAITSLGVSCATAADLAGGKRRLAQTMKVPAGLSANTLQVTAGPVWSLEAEVARLAAVGITGVGFALGIDLFNSALPRPSPATSVFESQNTSIPVSAVSPSSDGTKLFGLLAQVTRSLSLFFF